MRHFDNVESMTVLAVAIMLTMAAFAGVPETLGAHPWWGREAVVIGTFLGAVLFVALRKTHLTAARLLGIGLLLVAMSAAAAHFGKQFFVNSFADNALAGRLWYIGWHALPASLLITSGAASRFTRGFQ